MLNEMWREIVGYEGYYAISNLGRVKALCRLVASKWAAGRRIKEKFLRFDSDKDGYLRVQLNKNGKGRRFSVHRLVATAFIPNPENKPLINHRDFNTANNTVDNLEWCTYAENSDWSRRFGRLINSEETKKRKSAASSLRTNSPETRAKISEATRGKPKPGLKGKPKTEEHRRRIGEALKRLPKDVCLARVAALRGRHLSEETKRKISETRKRRISEGLYK